MLVGWEVTLALEAKSRGAAAATGSFDAAAADDEEVDPTELRVEGKEEEERSAEGRGVCKPAEGFAMAVRCELGAREGRGWGNFYGEGSLGQGQR